MAEYALRDVNKPIGVSTHRWAEGLPMSLQGSLPTVEQLEIELNTVVVQGERGEVD